MALSNNDIIELDSQTAVYFSRNVESHDVLTYIMSRIGKADKLFISSFAVSDNFNRKIANIRKDVGELIVLLDFTIATRKKANTIFIANMSDQLFLTRNHSKVIASLGSQKAIAIISNNATENHRVESGFISFNPDFVNAYEKIIYKELKNAAPWI